MKQFLIFILSIIYFTVSTGFVVNVHYCMGKISTVKFEEPKQKCCCKKKNKPCCKTEQQLVKLSSNSKLTDAWVAANTSFSEAITIPYFYCINDDNSTIVDIDLTYKYAPPIKEKRYALLHYCTLRI